MDETQAEDLPPTLERIPRERRASLGQEAPVGRPSAPAKSSCGGRPTGRHGKANTSLGPWDLVDAGVDRGVFDARLEGVCWQLRRQQWANRRWRRRCHGYDRWLHGLPAGRQEVEPDDHAEQQRDSRHDGSRPPVAKATAELDIGIHTTLLRQTGAIRWRGCGSTGGRTAATPAGRPGWFTSPYSNWIELTICSTSASISGLAPL